MELEFLEEPAIPFNESEEQELPFDDIEVIELECEEKDNETIIIQ